MEIQHFDHQHTLILCNMGNVGINCSGCKLPFFGDPAYICRPCKYFLHQQCGELPREIQHPSHPLHPLTLLARAPYRSRKLKFECSACHKVCSGFTYHCSECKFDLDILCACWFSPVLNDDNQEQQIQHFTHFHPLILFAFHEQVSQFDCDMCGQIIKGLTYSRITCKRFIHKSCVELPLQIQHPFHPPHPLTLLLTFESKTSECFACREESVLDFSFQCSECEFYLHIHCSRFIPNNNAHKQSINHFSHRHPLIPVECSNNNYRFLCSGCNEPIKGSIYVCVKSKFFVHKSCIELPQKIDHTFHPHDLTLLPKSPYGSSKPTFVCFACGQNSSGFTYHCSKCQYDLDIKCCMELHNIGDEHGQQIQHCSHEHPLFSFYVENSKLVCYGCSLLLDGSSYTCPQCGFMLHKSCAEFPQEIQHLFHPQHPLFIVAPKDFTELRLCRACYSFQQSCFVYNCAHCDFDLDLDCASLKPTITYESHEHPLVPMDKHIKEYMGDFGCDICNFKLRDFFLRCVPCNLDLHVSCIPALPHTAKCQTHRHLLTLSNPVPEDGSDKYYCDACETERNPKHFVYYCTNSKCEFVAHIDCAVPEPSKVLLAAEEEESYVAHQVRELGYFVTDSNGKEKAEDSEVREEKDEDLEDGAGSEEEEEEEASEYGEGQELEGDEDLEDSLDSKIDVVIEKLRSIKYLTRHHQLAPQTSFSKNHHLPYRAPYD